MATAAAVSTRTPAAPTGLTRVIWTNVVFSTITSAILLLDAESIAAFMGIQEPGWLRFMSIDILLFAGFVALALRRNKLSDTLIKLIIGVDFAWVIATLVLLVSNLLNLTTGGNWTILIIGDIVLALGIAEVITYRRYTKGTLV